MVARRRINVYWLSAVVFTGLYISSSHIVERSKPQVGAEFTEPRGTELIIEQSRHFRLVGVEHLAAELCVELISKADQQTDQRQAIA